MEYTLLYGEVVLPQNPRAKTFLFLNLLIIFFTMPTILEIVAQW